MNLSTGFTTSFQRDLIFYLKIKKCVFLSHFVHAGDLNVGLVSTAPVLTEGGVTFSIDQQSFV